jgi:hypothetical protein
MGFKLLLLVTLVVPVVPRSASRAEAGVLQRGVSSTNHASSQHSNAINSPGQLKGSLQSSWIGRVLSCAAEPAVNYVGAARRQLQECSCGPPQAQQVEVESADSFVITSGSATASVANTSSSKSDRNSIADQLLLMKIKVLPVPASTIQRKLASGKDAATHFSNLQFYSGSAKQVLGRCIPANPAAPGVAHLLRMHHIPIHSALRTSTVCLSGGITSVDWTHSLLRNLSSTAAAELGVPASNVQVELSASLAAGLQLPAPTLQQQPAASQAVAVFLETISSTGSPSVLVGVDLVRPAGDMTGPTTGSSSSAAVIAIGSISGLGDVTHSLRIASAMQRQCPELFVRGAAFTEADSACAALLAKGYLPALAGQDSSAAAEASASAALVNSTAGLSPAPGTNSSASNSTASNSTVSNSTADSGITRSSFAVRVVMPVAVNIKLTVAVRAGPGHDAESLGAAAHTWLASQDFQQLLEEQGLQTGHGTPARLVAVMPQPGSSSSSNPGADNDANDDVVSGGGGANDKGYNRESGWFIPWKPGHGSSSGALPAPQAGLPQKAPGTAGMAAREDPDGWVELSHEQHDASQKKQQSLAVIVGGLLAATMLGAGTAVGVVAVVRRRKARREKQGKAGRSKGSDGADGSSRGGSSAERRARRVSAVVQSASKSAACGSIMCNVQHRQRTHVLPTSLLEPICLPCAMSDLSVAVLCLLCCAVLIRLQRTRSSRGIGKRYLKYLPSNLTASNLAAVAPPLLAGQASGSSTAPLSAAPAAAAAAADNLSVQPQPQQQHALLAAARANWESAVRTAGTSSSGSSSSGLAAPHSRSTSPSYDAGGGAASPQPAAAAAATAEAPGAAVAPWMAASQAVGGWDVSGQRTGCMLLMSAVSDSLQDSMQQQQSSQQQQQQLQLSIQHSWQEQELQQRQQQPGSFSRLRSLLRWMPSAPIGMGDAASLLPGMTQRSHSSMGTAAAATDAATVRNLRNELCRDSVSSAARWDWLRQSQAGSPEASPDSMSDSLGRSSGSSMTSSLHSSRSSSRNSNGGSFRIPAARTAAEAAGDVGPVLAAGDASVTRNDDGGSCVISIADEQQQQHMMEASSSGAISSSCSGRVDDGSCAGASTATCSSSLASQQQLRQTWWQQQQQQQPGDVGDPCAAGCTTAGAAAVGPASGQASSAAQSAAEAAEALAAAIHPSEWLGFRSVGTPDQAGSAAAAAGGVAGCFVLDSRLLEEAAAAAATAAAAAGGEKAAAGPSPFQLHYDFSALQDQ